MFEVHHTVEIAYVLVISMWGFNGFDWVYLGNQLALQQAMTEDQCAYLIDEGMWKPVINNQFYRMLAECHPMDTGS
tara:strand:- start:899 stop:1126 length:228 start_codon:yes stop_codon:yes gene_type:complete